MTTSHQTALLHLAERLTPANQALALPFAGSDSFFDWTVDDWRARGLPAEIAASLALTEAQRTALHARAERLAEMGGRAVCRLDAAFPYTLDQAHTLPPILFARGSLGTWTRAGVGIVGTRKPSRYGAEIARKIAIEAAVRGVMVVSGAATGIDTAAHEGALSAKGPTVAVLGCGLFHVFPRGADALYDAIAENGLLLSQFVPTQNPDRKTFPIRNAIIAALSESVVVVEGAKRSGARYTADYAKEMGRRLFAVPGDITKPSSHLPNQLLKEGAHALTDPADPFSPLAGRRALQAELALGEPATPARSSSPKAAVLPPLEPLARKLLDKIVSGTEHADDLLAAVGADPGAFNAALLDLELKGLVNQEPGRRYTPTLGAANAPHDK